MAERTHGLVGCAKKPNRSGFKCTATPRLQLVVFGLVGHAAVITTKGGRNIP